MKRQITRKRIAFGVLEKGRVVPCLFGRKRDAESNRTPSEVVVRVAYRVTRTYPVKRARSTTTALNVLADANAHRPKVWMCPACGTRFRIENAPNHAERCQLLRPITCFKDGPP